MSFLEELTFKCILCDSSVLSVTSHYLGEYYQWKCENCGPWGAHSSLYGGKLGLKISATERKKLKFLVYENHLKKANSPVPTFTLKHGEASDSTDDVWLISKGEFLSRYPKKPLEYFDRALENIGRLIPDPTSSTDIGPKIHLALFSESNTEGTMLRHLSELGYISIEDADTHDTYGKISILPKGWARLQDIETPGKNSVQAFVAMWFDKSQDEFFEKGLRPAIEKDGGITAHRIDRKDHNNKIDDEIVAEIKRSKYLVADFTGHRGGVYFEAGLALGLGLPVIWCCHEDHIKDAHFDTRQYNHITYKTPAELKTKLLNRIRATIT
ncbi:hypothetical protein [Oleiharenicola lentus]|uniref:hypothetical protein n=1 Tax=Oleiharenicola lentus TaxID=2508720 RepID=UPI003F66A59F